MGAPRRLPRPLLAARFLGAVVVFFYFYFFVFFVAFVIFFLRKSILLKILVGMGHLGRSDHGEMSSLGAFVW